MIPYRKIRRKLQLVGPNGTALAGIWITNPSLSTTSSNSILAYHPRYKDYHNSGLAGIFVNIKKVFPCLKKLSGNYPPSCTTVTDEEDGFKKGKAISNLEILVTMLRCLVRLGLFLHIMVLQYKAVQK